MVPETSVYLPLTHMTRLLARENVTELHFLLNYTGKVIVNQSHFTVIVMLAAALSPNLREAALDRL
jgi:hypothetical protein